MHSDTNHQDCEHPASSSHSQRSFLHQSTNVWRRQQQQQHVWTGKMQGVRSATAAGTAAASSNSSDLTTNHGSSHGPAASSQQRHHALHSAQKRAEAVLPSVAGAEALSSWLVHNQQDQQRDLLLDPLSLGFETAIDLDNSDPDPTQSPGTFIILPGDQTVNTCDLGVKDLCHVSKDGSSSGSSSKRRKSGDSSDSSNLQLTAQLRWPNTAAAAATGVDDVWCNTRSEMTCMTASQQNIAAHDHFTAAANAAAANAVSSSALGIVSFSKPRANAATTVANSTKQLEQQQQQVSSSNDLGYSPGISHNAAAATAAAGQVASPISSACFMEARQDVMDAPTQQTAAAAAVAAAMRTRTASISWQQQQQLVRTPAAATGTYHQAVAGASSPFGLQQVPGNVQFLATSSSSQLQQQQQQQPCASTLEPLPPSSVVMLSASMPLLLQQQQQQPQQPAQCSTPPLLPGPVPVVPFDVAQQQQQPPVKLFGPFAIACPDFSNPQRRFMASTSFDVPNGQHQAAAPDQPGLLLQEAAAAAGSSTITVPAGTTVRLSDLLSPKICANAHLALQQRLQAAYHGGYADAVEYCQQQFKRQQQRAAQQQRQKQQVDSAAAAANCALPKGLKRYRSDSSRALVLNPIRGKNPAGSPAASPYAAAAAAAAVGGRPEPDPQVLRTVAAAAVAACNPTPAMAVLLQVDRKEAEARLRSMSDKELLLLAAHAVQQQIPCTVVQSGQA